MQPSHRIIHQIDNILTAEYWIITAVHVRYTQVPDTPILSMVGLAYYSRVYIYARLTVTGVNRISLIADTSASTIVLVVEQHDHQQEQQANGEYNANARRCCSL